MDPKIKLHFKKMDPVLYRLLKLVGESKIVLSSKPSRQYFRALCADIISQQLSGKVADVFWTRFLKLFQPGQPSPDKLLALPDSSLRKIGISNSKTAYLKNLAEHVINKKIGLSKLSELSDEEVIKSLTIVKGIGCWTAEMFCMFSLGRPDMFSPGDQGLKNAIKKYYSQVPDPVIWSPYRTYACLILWKSLDL